MSERPTGGRPLFACDIESLFGEHETVHVFAWDEAGHPAAVRIDARTPQECAQAVEAIKHSPASFVVFNGKRYRLQGEVQVSDPATPGSADELSLEFDVEYVGLDAQKRPRIYLFTSTEEEWETARRAVSHLLQQELLSPLSCIEGDHTGERQVVTAADLTHPSPESGSSIVSLAREHAYRVQNGLEGVELEDDRA